jgi:hypothetical protein
MMATANELTITFDGIDLDALDKAAKSVGLVKCVDSRGYEHPGEYELPGCHYKVSFIDVGYKNGKPYWTLSVSVSDNEKAGINLLHHYIKYLDDLMFQENRINSIRSSPL